MIDRTRAADAPFGWAGPVRERAGRLEAWLAEMRAGCAAGSDAAALYDQLSRLSDAELERRGFSRDDVQRIVFQAIAKAP
jgi:hypothetical protein